MKNPETENGTSTLKEAKPKMAEAYERSPLVLTLQEGGCANYEIRVPNDTDVVQLVYDVFEDICQGGLATVYMFLPLRRGAVVDHVFPGCAPLGQAPFHDRYVFDGDRWIVVEGAYAPEER